MTITMNDVRGHLDPDEVDYAEAQKLGAEAIPFLMELVQGGDPGLASKATYLASMIRSEQSRSVVEKAAQSADPVVRVAAASGLGNLPETEAGKMMELMQNDPDAGVRKSVLKSVVKLKSPELTMRAQQMVEKEPEPFVRNFAVNLYQMRDSAVRDGEVSSDQPF